MKTIIEQKLTQARVEAERAAVTLAAAIASGLPNDAPPLRPRYRATEALVEIARKYGMRVTIEAIELACGRRNFIQRAYPTGERYDGEEVMCGVDFLRPEELPYAALEPLRRVARTAKVPLREVVEGFNRWVASGKLEGSLAEQEEGWVVPGAGSSLSRIAANAGAARVDNAYRTAPQNARSARGSPRVGGGHVDGALRRASFDRFVDAVAERLEQGERQYHGRTFELRASSIIAEAQAEVLDNAAYSFIAWCRLERLRDEIERAEVALLSVADQQKQDQHAETGVQDRRSDEESLRVPGRKLGHVSEVSEHAPHGETESGGTHEEKETA